MEESTGYGTTTQMIVNGVQTIAYCLTTDEYLIYSDPQRQRYIGVVFKAKETDALWQIKLKGGHDPENCTTSLKASIAMLMNRATKAAEQSAIEMADTLRWRSKLQGRQKAKAIRGASIE